MTDKGDLYDQLGSSNQRVMTAMSRLDAANIAQGLPADSPYIVGDEALAAALELKAANQEQKAIIDQLLVETDPSLK